MEKKEAVLEVKDLSVIYKSDLETVYAVNHISFSIEKGETLGLVGETGAGKTTTALGIMRLLPQRTARFTSGEILLEGVDLKNLSEKEIIRATVETVAENTVDGLIAPLFYAFVGACINVGGISLAAPLAMTYKAINTLDSSVGYKNEKYLHIGFASAKIDDIANYIPSRISVILFTIGNLFLRNDYKNCFKISIRDRKNHKSPNCAFSEGAVAGALGIQLGGTNIYFGETVYKPTIGDKTREIEVQDISRTNKILYATSLTSMLVFTLFYVIIYHIFM